MLNISICIITRNECDKLQCCLEALMPLGFELVVVDTGSEDGTCDMVVRYTDKLYHYEWIDDFAAAKNYAASMASNDMVMIVDSDECLSIQDSKGGFDSETLAAAFLKIVEAHPEEVGRIYRHNEVIQGDDINIYYDWTNRIFDRRKYCFKGRIHEQIVRGNVFEGPVKDDLSIKYNTYMTMLSFKHDGYVGNKEQIISKGKRNVSLLLKELEESPEDVYILYQIGKAYFMMEDYENAQEYFGRALEYEVEPSYEYVQDLVETYGYALINCGRPSIAVLLDTVEAEFGHSADYRFMLGLAYMNNGQFDKAVNSFNMATKVDKGKMQGVDSYLAWYNMGVIFECLGDMKRASKYYKKSGNYEKAIIRLKEIQ